MKERIKGIDGLRGTAIFFIAFVYHYSCVYGVYPQNRFLMFLCEQGHLGVELFFCISGMVLFLSYEKRIYEMGCWEFFKRRAARLMPLVVLSTIFVGGGIWPMFFWDFRYKAIIRC